MIIAALKVTFTLTDSSLIDLNFVIGIKFILTDIAGVMGSVFVDVGKVYFDPLIPRLCSNQLYRILKSLIPMAKNWWKA
jgi:hypothetical protein